MTSYKSTIGGALSALGTALIGVGVVPQIATGPSHVLMWVSLIGFALDALGKFFAHLFSADKTDVRRMIARNESEADTKFITKQEAGERLDEKQDTKETATR